MKTKMNLARGGGASASKKLLAAIAVLAVAFAVFAAIPVAVDDSDATGTTVYYDADIKTPDASNFNTLKGAIGAAGENGTVILKTDVKANGETLTNGVFGITTAVTIKSADSKDKNIPFGISTTNSLTLQDVVLSPAKGTTALEFKATGGDLVVKGCIINVNGGDDADANGVYTKRGDGFNVNPASSVTIEGNTFVNVTKGGYVRAMFISTVAGDVNIKNNIANGFHVFAATQNVSTEDNKLTTISGNTAKDMTGDVRGHQSGDSTKPVETKDSKFVQIAGNSASKVVVKENTVTAKNAGDKIPYVNAYDLGATGASITVDKDMTVNGLLTISGTVEVGGLITVKKFDDKQGTITIDANSTLIVNGGLVGYENATITNNGTLFNNSTITMPTGEDVADNYTSTTGKFVAGAGSTATFKTSVTGNDRFVGSGTVNGVAPVTKEASVGSFVELKNYLDAGVPTVKITGDVALDENITVKADTILDLQSNNLNLNGKNVTVEGKIKGAIVVKNDTTVVDQITTDLTGNFKIVKGNSIDITDITDIDGTITVNTGALEITGKVTGTLTIDANGKTVKFSDVTVNSGAKLILKGAGTFTVDEDKAFNLYGSIATKGVNAPSTISVVVPDKATFKAYSGSQIAGTILVTGPTGAEAGTIDLSQAQNPQSVGEDISYDKTYGQLENVTVVGSLTIKNNSTVIVKGGFQVNEGVTLTIENGSTLKIESLAASMIVDGRIVVEEGGKLIVTEAKDVKVSGSIDSDGTVVINSKVTIKSGGAITINDGTVGKATTTSDIDVIKALYKSTFEPKKGLVVEAGATLTVKSLMYSDAAMNIDNKGTVVFDKAIIGGANVNVNMLADGAVVQVLSIENIPSAFGTDGKVTTLENNNLIITDDKLEFADKKVVGSPDGCKANKLTIAPGDYAFKGLTVVEKVTSYTDEAGKKQYNNNLDIAGAVSVSKIKDTPSTPASFSVEGDRVAVSGELTLGKDVLFEVKEMAKLSVSGKLVATEEAKQIDNKGEITVTGLVQATKDDAIGTINAAMYESKIGTTTVYNYTTLKAAIDSGAKDITVSGKIYVTESVTVPAGVTIKNNGEIVVGSADDTEVVLTVADTASIKYGKVTVYGTLYFENKKDNKAAEIESDVSVIGEKDARYTNLFTALNNANAGETVTVDKTTVDLKKSITIKDGVTLDVPNSKALKVYAGVTITVNGILKTAEKIETATFTKTDGTEAQVTFALAADKLNGKAAIIVNGVFMSGVEFSYNGAAPAYMIPGAYYSLTDDAGAYNYVTTLENASKTAATSVTVYGKVSAGDVVFTGTDSEPKVVTVAGNAELTVSSITLDKTAFTVGDAKFTGDVKAGDAAVSVKLVKSMAVSVDKDGLFTVDSVTNVDKTSSFKVSAGSVYIEAASMNVTVSAGATLVSAAAGTVLDKALTIEGTVSVANEQTITVKDDVTVKGALSVADATDSKIAGTFNAEKNLYIGLTPKDVTGDAASVSGAVSEVQVAFVKADANVSDATIESFKVDGVLKSTTYVVEGKDWMTVYDRTGNYYIGKVTEAPFENAEFKANKWLSTDGESADKKVIGASKCDKVTANIEYKIYTIQITPCAGVESIAIDGNLIGDYNYGDYSSVKVKAGSHTVTYSLANGYSGEAKLSLVSSGDKTTASVSGQTFTVSGEKGVVKLQLTGVEKSGYVEPVTPSEDNGDDGLTITDYLLIVLVVLIVIMAIIVAMRLMRS